MKANVTYSDELPDKAHLAQRPDILLHLLLAQPCRLPVEAWAQVVREHVPGPRAPDALRELLRLCQNRLLRLHPQQISVRRERDGTVNRTLRTALVAVVSLPCTRECPSPSTGSRSSAGRTVRG